MKKLLTVIGVLISMFASAQPTQNYSKIDQGYDWLRGYFRALHAPAGPNPVLASRQWPGAGAVYVDSTDHLFYFYSGGTWRTAAGSANSNVGSAMRLAIPGTNNIKTLIARHGILIDSTTSNSLGFTADTVTSVTGIATVGDIDRANANLWNKVGNAGTTAAINFLGTTDSVDLRFRVNNIRAGRITPLGDDYLDSLKAGGIYLGNYAGFNDTADIKNSIAIGSYALRNYASGEPGSGSIAIGHMALYSYVGGVSTGSNVAIGTRSQARNISGFRNVSVGLNSGHSLTTGQKNTFIGTFAGEATSTGVNNDALGEGSLRNNTVGTANSALGNNSLFNTSGSIGSIAVTAGGSGYTTASVTISSPDTPAFGFPSFTQATATATVNAGAVTAITVTNRGTGYSSPVTVTITGDGTGATATATIALPDRNTAAGVSGLYGNVSGYGNSSIGYQAGASSVIDSFNTYIGYQADRNLASPTTVSMSRSTAIGYNAKVGQSNSLVLGGTGSDQPKVGIGNIAPQDKFHVTGRVRFDSALVFLGTTTANSGFIGSIGSAFIGMPNLNANGSLNPIYMKNASNGSNAAIGIQLDNDLGSLAIFGMQGSNRTSFNPDGLVISTNGAGGIKMIPGTNGGYFKIGYGLGTTNDTRIYKDSLFTGLRLGTTADDTARMVYFNTTTKEFTYYTPPFGSGGGSGITALTGDVTASGSGSVAATLATVNSDVGSFTNANITVNAKGLITAASNGTAGDFSGPASSTDNAVVRFDGTGGKTGQNSVVTISDAGAIAGMTGIASANVSMAPYTSSSSNDAWLITNNSAGAVLGIRNNNGGGFVGMEHFNNSGTMVYFQGFNNGVTGEYRYNNVATSGHIRFMIAGTDAMRLNNAGEVLANNVSDQGAFGLQTTSFISTGAVRFNSAINLNGSNGTSGQFLTSGGSGAATWTSLPTLNSGSSTPTGTAGTNADAVTPSEMHWTRVGDVVTFSGTVTIDATVGSGNTVVELSLPVASDFASTTDAAGTIVQGTSPNPTSGWVMGSVANDRIVLTVTAVSTSGATYFYTGSYKVLLP